MYIPRVIQDFDEVKRRLDKLHDEAFEKLSWEMDKDDSKFVCAYFDTQPDGSWVRCTIYTELKVYIASDRELTGRYYTAWSSAVRNP